MTDREWKRLNELDREDKRKNRFLVLLLAGLLAVTVLMGGLIYQIVLQPHNYALDMVYDRNNTSFGIPGSLSMDKTAGSFAKDLCVTDRDVNASSLYLTSYSAGLFNLNQQKVEYARDIFTQRPPASITKIMTALVALKYGNLEDEVTVTPTALNIEYGSSVCDIRVGDHLTLRQLIYGLMVASGNDAAMMIAEHVGGTVEHFVEMMNEEALSLGATRTHFANPHGLEDPQHYTCVYDIYLIFLEAIRYDIFMDIINRTNYYAEYTDENGDHAAVTWESTNYYFLGNARAPSNVIIYGGKTGTTDEAGSCLALLSRDLYGNPYISVILHAPDKDVLYQEMNSILGLIAL